MNDKDTSVEIEFIREIEKGKCNKIPGELLKKISNSLSAKKFTKIPIKEWKYDMAYIGGDTVNEEGSEHFSKEGVEISNIEISVGTGYDIWSFGEGEIGIFKFSESEEEWEPMWNHGKEGTEWDYKSDPVFIINFKDNGYIQRCWKLWLTG